MTIVLEKKGREGENPEDETVGKEKGATGGWCICLGCLFGEKE